MIAIFFHSNTPLNVFFMKIKKKISVDSIIVKKSPGLGKGINQIIYITEQNLSRIYYFWYKHVPILSFVEGNLIYKGE